MAVLSVRGSADIFIACVDGLKGFPEAVESVFPQTEVQLCIVHLVHHSLNYVGWKQRKEVAADLKTIYTSATEAEAEQRLAEFSVKWDVKFPMIAKSWRSNWARSHSVLRAPAGNSPGDLHDQRDRVAKHVAA